MKCKTAVLWWLINNKEHNQLKKRDKTIEALMPLVEALFPGIDYYSMSGFGEVMRECVIPALKKRFPELLTTPAEKIKPRTRMEVAVMLPSKGYEWQDNPKWRSKFKKLLSAV